MIHGRTSLNNRLAKYIGKIIGQTPLGKESPTMINHLLSTDLQLIHEYMQYIEPCRACWRVPVFSVVEMDTPEIKGEAFVFGCECHKVIVLGNENIVHAIEAWNVRTHPVVSLKMEVHCEENSNIVNGTHACNG